MTKPEERTCDACGAAAVRAPTYPHSDTFHVGPDFGNVALCTEHWLASGNENKRLILARRAAQPKEVDPRTLPVGAVFRYREFQYQWVVTSPGFAQYVDETLGHPPQMLYGDPVVVISLPPAEVELGTLDVPEPPVPEVRCCLVCEQPFGPFRKEAEPYGIPSKRCGDCVGAR